MKKALPFLVSLAVVTSAWAAWPTLAGSDLIISLQPQGSNAEIRVLERDGQGGYIAAFGQTPPGSGANIDIFVEKVTAAGEVTWNQATDGGYMGKLAVTASGDQWPFGVVLDATGGFFLGYFDGTNTIRVQHFDSNANVVSGFNAFMGTGDIAQMTSNGSGGVVLLYGTYLTVSLVNLDATGVPVLGPTQAASNSDLRNVQMVPDGTGGFVVGYTYYVSPQVARFTSTFQKSFAANITTSISPQSGSTLDVCGDGVGGAWALIQEAQSGGSQNTLYLQRTFIDGGFLFRPADGGLTSEPRRVTSTEPLAGRSERLINIEPDGLGGAYLVWNDVRSGQQLPMAQHVTPSGADMWTAGGVVLATAQISTRANGSGRVDPVVRPGKDVTFFWGTELPATIRAQRMTFDGGRDFPFGGVLVSTGSAQYLRRLVTTGETDGTVVIGSTFYGGSGSNTGTVQLKKILPDGTLGSFVDAGTGGGAGGSGGSSGGGAGGSGGSSGGGAGGSGGSSGGGAGGSGGSSGGGAGGSGGSSGGGAGGSGGSSGGGAGGSGGGVSTPDAGGKLPDGGDGTGNQMNSGVGCGCQAFDGSTALAALGLLSALSARRRRNR